MTKEQELDELLSGTFYAYDALLNFLLKDYIERNADTGADTEHLEAMLRDIWAAFDKNRPLLSDIAEKQALRKVSDLVAVSLQKYRKEKDDQSS